ncbi:hypothetical protein ACHAXH_008706 [Discostella pseudostelligera]
MSWESPPVHRHLSTIGIGPVFVCPPPYPLLQPQQLDEESSTDVSKHDGLDVSPPSQPNHGNEILTWEIAGDIKTTPEDFIVREIGWAPTRLPTDVEHHTDRNNESEDRNVGTATQTKSTVVWSRKIAGLECDYPTTSDADVDGIDTGQGNENDMITKNERPPNADEKIEPNRLSLNNLQEESTDQLPPSPPNSQHETDLEYFTCSDPTDGLRRMLIASITNDSDMTGSLATQEEGEIAAVAILKELTDLQNVALDEIDSASSAKIDGHTNDDKYVWISVAKLDKDSRSLLHRYIRQSFPLLCTETSSARPSDERIGVDSVGTNNHDNDITAKESSPNIKNWVRALIDRTYFSVAPCLVNPRQDLLALYKFRNYGPVAVLNEDGKRCSKTDRSRHQSNGDNSMSPRRINSISQGVVYLRLRHDLPKNDRRAIHQALSSSRRREFETSTIHDVPSDDADKDSILSTAIVVQWSNQALKSQKKRKRKDEENNTTINNSQSEQNPEVTAIFCVLRKYQCEHQVAVSSIVRALKCRAGDIGLAGIKDMKAITYQFCTLRGVHVQRIHRANRSLGNRIQLVNMMEVQGSDSLLDRGKLIGNHFEITIRNMKRMKQFQVEGTQKWKEQKVTLRSSHLDAMVKRIYDFGFINFYGEQRVGDAGLRRHVGVRSFDVGRAMLQCDFSEAINLIMIGRSNNVYNPGLDEINAREVWKASGGDARKTLKAFPTNRNTMVRERDLMKGLLRYDDPLAAIRCIPHNVRMFWIHAYQSHVWNRIATERIKRWGLRPVVGDLYIKNKTGSSNKDKVNTDVQVVHDPTGVDIFEIVLPLPGYNIQYPSNEIGELYRDILHDDGIELNKGDVPEATAKGSYRKLIQKANGLKWNIVPDHDTEEPDLSNDPVVGAVQFTFELESGCYATMMLRELMVTTMARDNKIE